MSATRLKLFSELKIAPAHLDRHYFLYIYSLQDGTFLPNDNLGYLSFSNGQLHIDGMPVLHPQFSPNTVSWKQKTAHHYTTGNLLFSKNNITGHGTISLGTGPEASSLYSVMASAIPTGTFSTQITKQRYPVGTDPNTLPSDAWQPGLDLELGYRLAPELRIPQPFLKINQIEHASDYSLLTTRENQLEVSFKLDADAESPPVQGTRTYVDGKLTLSLSGDSFQGVLTRISADDNESNTGVYLWKGLVPSVSRVFKALAKRELSEVDVLVDDTLHLTELLSLMPDEKVSAMSHSMMAENMRWAINSSEDEKHWLSDFFSLNPPVLDDTRSKLINQHLSWYQNDFAVSYLAKGMSESYDSGIPAPIQLTPLQKAKLDKHLTTGLSQSKEYNIQSDGIYMQAYLSAKTRLKAYIDDGGEKWAAQVLAHLSLPSQLSQAMLRLHSEFDMSLVNNSTTLLMALDPSGKSSQQYQKIIMGRLTLQTGLFDTKVTDEEVTLNWLPHALESLAAGNTPRLHAELFATNSLSNEFSNAVEDVKKAFKYFGDATKAAKAIFSCFSLYAGYKLTDQIANATEAFNREYPTLAGVGKLFTFLAWAGGVFNTAVSFMNWKSQDDVKKATVITKCVDLVLGLAKIGVDLLNPFVKGSIQALENAMSEGSRLTGLVEEIVTSCISGEIQSGEAIWQLQGVLSGLDLVNKETKALESPVLWEKVFTKTSLVVKAFAVAVTATTLVLNVIEFVRDIIHGKPIQQTILDGITIGLTLATLVIQIVELVVSSVVCTVLSAAFALLGLVFTIIQLFLPKPKEPTPVENFKQKYAIPFIEKLPDAKPSTLMLTQLPKLDIELVYNMEHIEKPPL